MSFRYHGRHRYGEHSLPVYVIAFRRRMEAELGSWVTA